MASATAGVPGISVPAMMSVMVSVLSGAMYYEGIVRPFFLHHVGRAAFGAASVRP
ncbi:hypothetical protein SHO565_43410 [Streptomyces sp. HO565]